MSRVTDIPISELKNKPAHGAPCNNCGLCCRAVLCSLAQHVFHPEIPQNQHVPGPCPALEIEDGKQLCGLINNPAKYKPSISPAEAPVYSAATKYILAAGTGCTARFNGEKADLDFYHELDLWDIVNFVHVINAKKLWGLVR